MLPNTDFENYGLNCFGCSFFVLTLFMLSEFARTASASSFLMLGLFFIAGFEAVGLVLRSVFAIAYTDSSLGS